ncbi:hypothetical protein [Dactylosporangium sp. NPDC051541]|uniref:hypothetical protein n=1 Tax=Dactylosporangium sp. NPDC051541 TaxID=3363977 RepID=UPI0037A2C6F4
MHPTITAVQPAVPPSRAAELTSPEHITACLAQLQAGVEADLEAAFDDLFRKRPAGLTDAALGAARKQWLDAAFAVPQFAAVAAEHPRVCADLLIACIDLTQDAQTSTVPVAGDWPAAPLAALGNQPGVAALVLARRWRRPDRLGARVLAWLLDSLSSPAGLPMLNDPGNGLAAIACNMLWVGVADAAPLCALIKAGADTGLAKEIGLEADLNQPREGVYSGFVQPLEHVLAKYVGPVGDPSLHQTLTVTEQGRLQKAAVVLQALATRGNTSILTSYAEVRKSELVVGFADRPGSIWGFEHLRLPYVQAAHATPGGKRPIRMLELWNAVYQALGAAAFTQLLADPQTKIKQIVDQAIAETQEAIDRNSPWIAGYGSAEFLQEFRVQCTAYLQHLATTDPTAKFLTAEARGHTWGKYTGAFACKAGLWWAEREGQTVYYCLDGIKRDDVINYKRFKTKAINTYLRTGGRPYNEAITLAEVREILGRWSTLGRIVVFVRKGQILKGDALNEVLGWIPLMLKADAQVETRLAPPKATFAVQARRLGDDLLNTRSDTEIMQIVARAELVVMAAGAQAELLSGCLYDQGSNILFKAGIIPWGLRSDYSGLLATRDAKERLAKAARIEQRYGDGRVPAYLWNAILAAVQRFAKLQ